MKAIDKVFVSAALVSAACLIFVSSCDNDEKEVLPTSETSVRNSLVEGDWKVDYFFNKRDETNGFVNYTFQFSEEGETRATDSSRTVVNGNWRTSIGTASTVKVIFSYDVVDPFLKLNEDWNVVDRTDGMVRFEHRFSQTETAVLTLKRVGS